MKKILSILLAIAMLFSLGVSALADGDTGDDNTISSTTEGSNNKTKAVTASYTPTSGGTTTTAEAKWGADKDNLPNSGTLEAAIAAAEAEGSTVTYIQLQKDVTATSAYQILGGAFTLDLNGKTISSNAYVFEIGDESDNSTSGIDVTFTASGTTGKVESTGASYPAIEVICGTVTFNGGSYGALVMSNSGEEVPYASVTVKGGSFTSDTSEAITNNGGTLTIGGGSFTGDSCAVVALDGTTTIKDGSFTLNSSETPGAATIQYFSGKLDLSNYSGTTALTDLTVYNYGEALTVGDSTIKLPEGYGFYKSGDTNKATVTDLAANTNYAIQSTSGGTTTTDEAKWGASATDLPNSGTLAEAIAAVNDGNDAYIQLQTDVTATSSYSISREITVTIDLNGHTVTSSENGAIVLSYGYYGAPTVTIKDSAGGGKVSSSGSCAITVGAGTLTIDGGSYEGTDRAISAGTTSGRTANVTINNGTFSATGTAGYAINNGTGGTLTIEGGSFTGSTAVNSTGTLTIEGGSFTGDSVALLVSGAATIKGGSFTLTNSSASKAATIQYWGGKLDLSGYTGTVTDLTVYAGTAVTVSADTIVLPSGCSFYAKGDTTQATVTSLAASTVYAIKSTSGGDEPTTAEAMWGADKDNLNNSGTLAEAIAAANTNSSIKYIQLQKNVTATSSYQILGGGFTLDLNGKTISSSVYTVTINDSAVDMTFTDSSSGGRVETTGSAYFAIAVYKGKVTFTGGSYGSIKMDWSGNAVPNANVIINSGSFTNSKGYAVMNNGGKLTITGGTFSGSISDIYMFGTGTTTVTGGTFSTTSSYQFFYDDGAFDLSGYTGTVTDLTVYAGENVTVGDSTIKLPSGYGFYKRGDANQTIVTSLAASTVYAIKSTSGGTTTDTATITGVSVKVGDKTYATGTVTLTADSGEVTIVVTGTNFAKLSDDNKLGIRTSGMVEGLTEGTTGMTAVNTETNTATLTVSSSTLGSFVWEVVYTNNGADGNDGSSWTGTGIYIQYQAETTSVDITWGSMSFAYSDEQVSGADKGWTCASGANAVKVENKGTAAVTAGVAFAKSSSVANVTNVTGSFDKTSATLAASASDTFTLTLSGKPDGALAEGTVIGNVTVTITGAGS